MAKKESIDKVKDNPYRLADDIWGIGFKTADGIAAKMGYEKSDLRRCRSGILYTLSQLSNDGHVYAEEEQLIKSAMQLLEVEEEPVKQAMAQMIEAKDLELDQEAIYLPPFYYAECGAANRLIALVEAVEADKKKPTFNLAAISQETGIEYDDVQIAAIQQAVESKVMILTGGPGTGKTTTTQGIIAALKTAGMKILLAAPTGRAAKRMSEATGMEAKTIHRLLEYNPKDGYKRNEENPLEADALIVDECSMIDILLMNHLMKAISSGMRLVMVGDIDQSAIEQNTSPYPHATGSSRRIQSELGTSRCVESHLCLSEPGWLFLSERRPCNADTEQLRQRSIQWRLRIHRRSRYGRTYSHRKF